PAHPLFAASARCWPAVVREDAGAMDTRPENKRQTDDQSPFERERAVNKASPIERISAPEATLSQGYRSSGRMKRSRYSVMKPTAYTGDVCVAVTTSPSSSACFAVPLDPTRYAPTIVFP